MELDWAERIQIPEALVPVYQTERLDEPIALAAGDMVLRQDSLETSPSPGRVYSKWRPQPEIRFEIDDVASLIQTAYQQVAGPRLWACHLHP
ncbi:MAG TPA: hypothetical protein VOA80_12115 [Thermoanaerobaculia bacterium]|nr:hypothetical protein [Thermoanaerobaculia bacterium]